MHLAGDVATYLETLRVQRPSSKDEVRAVMMARKRENLIAARARLKQNEKRALNLLRRVDYSDIQPRLIVVAPDDKPVWDYCRHIVSSAPWMSRPGRANFLFAADVRSGGVMGIVDVGSDLLALGPRDRFIGWTAERKTSGGGLNHTANIGTCVGAAPFGWLTGGKFMAVACTTKRITDLWQRRYGDSLAGVTTTALFGRASVYNRLKEFAYLGDTPGQGTFHVDPKGFGLLKRFLTMNGILARAGGSGGHFTNKQDVLMRVLATLGVDPASVQSHQPRGVYFATLGDSALSFLRGDTKEFSPSSREQQEVAEWWLARWYPVRWPRVSADIAGFDWHVYHVDAQIDLCGAASERQAVPDLVTS